MSYRLAIYYAPDAAGPLWRKAAEWLGRDPASGQTANTDIAGVRRAELAGKSGSARRYGFHATIKPPMQLREGTSEADLVDALGAFAANHAPVPIGQLVLRRIDGFLALVPAAQPQALTDFAAAVVEALDPLRAPVSEADKARRNAGGRLSPRQVELLERYGYPYVMEQFQFHMTLTDRLSAADQERFELAARTHFGDVLDRKAVVDRLVLFHEPEPGAPFIRGADFTLRKESGR